MKGKNPTTTKENKFTIVKNKNNPKGYDARNRQSPPPMKSFARHCQKGR